MPARLIMDTDGASVPQEAKKDRLNAASDGVPQPQDFAIKPVASLAGKAASRENEGTLSNGAHSNSNARPMMNGHAKARDAAGAKMLSLAQRTAPPLDQSWRDSHANKSMGVLLDRLAQRCFADLNETLAKMADLPEQTQSSQPNGISTAAVDVSEASLARKRMFMDFAHSQRDRFIKTLVLADWSRNEHDMARVIDIRVWQDKQRNAQSSAISFIGTIKHNLSSAKMPNPNIEGALELLATGKAPHLPDLGYLPLQRLTAKQLLGTMQNMNVALSTRLNLHEELPAHFDNYTIANGRASFRVPGEFEVDLSIADEDYTSPFYFIDIRFLFSPTSHVLNDQLRAAFEARCNQAMATQGLQGCYDFLHNFVLTHKINVLHSQADGLQRDQWFDCLRVEAPRRVLVVQYWSGRPGPKSWLQFGIESGRRKGLSLRKPPSPALTVRWFRRGVEVQDDALTVDWQKLDLERILSGVIAKHITWSLGNISERLDTISSNKSGTRLRKRVATSLDTPEDCSLSLRPSSVPTWTTVKYEPVTGQIALLPPSPLTNSAELRLNRDALNDVSTTLANLLCSIVQERVGKTAELLGWTSVAGLTRQENLSEIFGKHVWSRSIYACNKAWGDEWALVVTFSVTGQKWWVVHIQNTPDAKAHLNARVISTTRQIPVLDTAHEPSTISRDLLLQIERLAEAEISFSALSKQLTTMRIQHRFERLTSMNSSLTGEDVPAPTPVAVYIKTSALLGHVPRRERGWATDVIKVTHAGADSDQSSGGENFGLRRDVCLTTRSGQLQHLEQYLRNGRQSDLATNPSGGLALWMRTPLGQPFVEQLQARLLSIERLNSYLAILALHKFTCVTATLTKLVFQYCNSPVLTAQLSFSKDGSLPARLKLEPVDSNVHQRIRVMLENCINSYSQDFFPVLTRTLEMTLPLMQSLEQLESKHSSKQSLKVHVRQPAWFTVAYTAPLPLCSFEIRCRSKIIDGKMMFIWQISQVNAPGAATLPDVVTDALKEVYQQQGDGWWSSGNGIAARASAVCAALGQLDETISKFENVKMSPPAEELDTKPLIQQSSIKKQVPQAVQQQPQKKALQQQQPQSRTVPPTAQARLNIAQTRPANGIFKQEVIELD